MKPKQRQPESGKGRKILIVEDSITQAEKLSFILREEGYAVEWKSDARQALDYLENPDPHIVISEVLMPGMDGFTLCARIKQSQRLAMIPVMLLTTLAEPQDILRGLECGADHLIVKPYKREYLLTQIRCMLANASLRKMSQKDSSALSDMGIDIFFAGKKHRIAANQLQILDLLFSTFEVYIQKNKELEEMNKQLAEKNEKIKALQGLVPICANCKKIRDDDGYWQQVDHYLAARSQADFNLSICPQCAKKEIPTG